MIYLLLSILASTFIFVVFKLFNRFNINTLQAIVVNYIVACISGLIAFDGTIQFSEIPQYDWFYYTLALGALFIVVFNLMALTTQKSGLSVVSVATKMSVVVPILFGLMYYKESLSFLKILGIALALLAVYLVSIKATTGLSINKKSLYLPLLVFLGSGVIDTSLKYLEEAFVAENDVSIFSATIFASAGVIGLFIVTVMALRGKLKLHFKNVVAGICLGVPNFFSIYFLVKALRTGLMDSSGIFTVNNVAIVMLSTFIGIFLFSERLQKKNWLGIIFAVLSILFIALGTDT